MTGASSAHVRREPLHGVRQIVRFNWPFYALAGALALSALLLPTRIMVGGPVRGALLLAVALAWFWLVGSLAASWAVYDRSNLMTCNWLPRALGIRADRWINVHAGLDETTPVVSGTLGGAGRSFDIFDATEMTEPSIARARAPALRAAESEPVDFRHLPAASGSVDAALLLLSAHELRREPPRVSLFREIHRVLRPGGRAVVAEHLRDTANVLAFGPGALHFHSRRTWLRTFATARFEVHHEFPITPFVRVFVLRRLP
jgi:SAM-dependent methyltransferase